MLQWVEAFMLNRRGKKTSHFVFIQKALFSIELRFQPSYIEVQHPTSRLAALRRLQEENATQSTVEMRFPLVCMLDLYNAVCTEFKCEIHHLQLETYVGPFLSF